MESGPQNLRTRCQTVSGREFVPASSPTRADATAQHTGKEKTTPFIGARGRQRSSSDCENKEYNGEDSVSRTASASAEDAIDMQKFISSLGYKVDGILGKFKLPAPPPSPKEKLYTFADSDAENNIILGDVVDKIVKVKGGTLEKLVERLTYAKYPDPKYLQAFLLTYRSFTTPQELLNILKARFNMKQPPTLLHASTASTPMSSSPVANSLNTLVASNSTGSTSSNNLNEQINTVSTPSRDGSFKDEPKPPGSAILMDNLSEDWDEFNDTGWGETQTKIRLRVFNVFRHWILKGFYDFTDNAELREAFVYFITNDMMSEMASAAKQLLKMFERQSKEESQQKHIILGEKPPKPILPAAISNLYASSTSTTTAMNPTANIHSTSASVPIPAFSSGNSDGSPGLSPSPSLSSPAISLESSQVQCNIAPSISPNATTPPSVTPNITPNSSSGTATILPSISSGGVEKTNAAAPSQTSSASTGSNISPSNSVAPYPPSNIPLAQSTIPAVVPPLPIPSSISFVLFDLHPVEIARQMTLIEYDLYKAIKPWECLNQNWMKKGKENLAPNILKMIHRFNEVGGWVASEVVSAETLRGRVSVLKKIVEIAWTCKSLNNFNAVMEILSGLQFSSVFRLKQTWAELSTKSHKLLKEMQTIMSRDNNFKNLRSYLHSVDPPCIPYLGMYLTDLTFVEEGNPDYLLDGKLINFAKREKVAFIIGEIQQYQQKPYCLEPVAIIQEYLKNRPILSEDTLYKLSLQREQRAGTEEKSGASVKKKKAGGIPSSLLIGPYGELELIPDYKFYDKDSDKNLITEEDEKEPSKVSIVGGTVYKLIERLTYEKYPDTEYVLAFLLTYLSFMTSTELLDLLIMRYYMPQPKAATSTKEQIQKFKAEKLTPIIFRVFNVLKNWVDKYYQNDFSGTPQLVAKLEGFIEEATSKHTVIEKAAAQLRNILNRKKEKTEPDQNIPVFMIGCNRALDETGACLSIFSLSPDILAIALHRLTEKYFFRIDWRECIAKNLIVSPPESPNVNAIRLLAKNVMKWVQTEVVKAKKLKERAEVISYFLRMAEVLIGIRDINNYVLIIQGLQKMERGMGSVWKLLTPRAEEWWKEQVSIIQNKKLSKEKLFANKPETDVECFPYLENVWKELTALDTTTPDFISSKIINFGKRVNIYNLLTPLMSIRRPVNLMDPIDASAESFLKNIEIYDEDTIKSEIPFLDNELSQDESVLQYFSEFPVSAEKIRRMTVVRTTDTVSTDAVEVELIRSVAEEEEKDMKDFLSFMLDEGIKKSTEKELKEIADVVLTQKNEIKSGWMRGKLAKTAAEVTVERFFGEGVNLCTWRKADTEGVVRGWPSEIQWIIVQPENSPSVICTVLQKSDKANMEATVKAIKFFKDSLSLELSVNSPNYRLRTRRFLANTTRQASLSSINVPTAPNSAQTNLSNQNNSLHGSTPPESSSPPASPHGPFPSAQQFGGAPGYTSSPTGLQGIIKSASELNDLKVKVFAHNLHEDAKSVAIANDIDIETNFQ